ncbi:MAG: ATP-binding protein [Marinifilaceae bacterium]
MAITEEKKKTVFMRKFYRKTGKAISDYNLIEEGDRILVGVSGGKDSLALLEVLAMRAKGRKENYTIIAAHIDAENIEYETDITYLQDFCDKLGVLFIAKTIKVDFQEQSNKPVCFVCSWNRRKALFELADEYKCNKLALGHHKDDAIETLLMNMMNNGIMSSMPAKLSMFDGLFTLIRPFIYQKDADVVEYATYQDFKKQVKFCPHENKTQRNRAKELVSQLESFNPHVRSNIFAAMSNIHTEYLP